MEPMYYIGLDVHKRKISYCVKDSGGKIYAEGSLPSMRMDLDHWMKTLPQPWSAAMEATMFTGWIRSPQAARSCTESGTPLDAASHRGSKKEKRPHRCQQDLRLPALRFLAGVLHGPDRDSRAATDAAIPQPAGPADGANENQDQFTADGSGSELQQATATQGRLLLGTAGAQSRYR
jgi:hypothetical protein